jgi:choline dehydrogenase-like flavoprotein
MYRETRIPVVDGYPDDPENLPEGSFVDGSQLTRDLNDIADYVVIGSGAAGASAAVVLAGRGYRVIILEEGPWVRTREFGVDVYPAMKRMFRESGTAMAMGRVLFPVLQGACVGGSTTVNSAIAWRAPERVIDNWGRRFGLGETLSFGKVDEQFDVIEQELNVQSVQDEALGNHNSVFAEAATTLGIRAERIRRYDSGCDASASCLTGCRSGKKLGMNVTHVPETLQR